jgi:capsular polysaccharide transport system permease protein
MIAGTLGRSLHIQFRVLGALLVREIITRYGRDNLGFLWIFVEPMIFTLGVTTLWTFTQHLHGSNLPIVAFSITGYSSVLLWRNCATRSATAIPVNLPLLFHRNVRVLDLLLTRIVLEIAGATMSAAVLTLTFVTAGFMDWPVDIVPVLCAWFLLAWFGGALAIVLGAVTAWTEIAERIWHPVAYLLFPLSGALFMVDWLPRSFQQVVLALPMVHGVEMLRHGWFGNAVRTHYDAGYMVVCCLALTLAGLAMTRLAARRVEL